jgi:phage-related protein
MEVAVAKPVAWMGTSRKDLRAFPDGARSVAGRQLYQVQLGRQPADFKPMLSVGSGVYEIRIHTQTEHRLLYVAKFEEAVYVLHAFEKRTRKTDRRDIEIARRRLAELFRARARR